RMEERDRARDPREERRHDLREDLVGLVETSACLEHLVELEEEQHLAYARLVLFFSIRDVPRDPDEAEERARRIAQRRLRRIEAPRSAVRGADLFGSAPRTVAQDARVVLHDF